MTDAPFTLAVWVITGLLLAILASIMYGPKVRGAAGRLRNAVKRRFSKK